MEDRFDDFLRAELSRRRLLGRGAAGALGMSLAAWLAACGGDDIGGTAEEKRPKVVPKGEISDSLYVANWPLYIDVDEKTKRRGTLEDFRKEFSTRVEYVEEVNDNTQFFGKVRQQYARGDSGGRDLHVVTDWMAARMIRLGYVHQLDRAELPTVERNLIDSLRNPPFDRDRAFSVPWQSGMTGLIYRKDKVKRAPRSINDIFDPDYKGKVTMLTEMRDSVPLVMLAEGDDPETAGVDAALKAIERIDRAAKSGQIRKFTGNEYTRDITKGDSWLIFGWSGDAIQLQADDPNIRFAFPDEGFNLWTDNMQIPVGAPHAYTAQKFMDFVYRPEVQVDITAYVNYVTPVTGVQELMEKRDPELARDRLVFPDAELLKRAKIFPALKPDEERTLEDAFQRVLGA